MTEKTEKTEKDSENGRLSSGCEYVRMPEKRASPSNARQCHSSDQVVDVGDRVAVCMTLTYDVIVRHRETTQTRTRDKAVDNRTYPCERGTGSVVINR